MSALNQLQRERGALARRRDLVGPEARLPRPPDGTTGGAEASGEKAPRQQASQLEALENLSG
jgi:hypothetical protein